MKKAMSRVLPVAVAGALAGWWLLDRGLSSGRGASSRTRRSLRGQVALVTGGSRGLGLALCHRLGRAGCRLVLCARNALELERARLALEAEGCVVATQVCDVTDRLQVQHLVAETLARFGALDILVNNAGIIEVGPLAAQTEHDFQAAMDTNFWGPLHLILETIPHMRTRRRGHIVNVASIGGAVSVPHLLPYGAAKAALLNLSEGLTAELSRDGICVTTVVPGLMRTGSPYAASFKGDRSAELAWFAVADSLPLLTTSAESAARQIVVAIAARRRRLVIGWSAKALRLAHALAPSAVLALATLVSGFLLPQAKPATAASGSRRGRAIPRSRLIEGLITPTRRAAEALNQDVGTLTVGRGKTDEPPRRG